MYTVERYNAKYYNEWNNFVSASKNGTFLFHRDFMEYHSDRFTDFSLLIFEGQKLIALLPANTVENVVHSHQGLTYGGLIIAAKARLISVTAIFKVVLNYLCQNNIATLFIKTIPHIYHKQPAEEIDYALFITNAKLVRRDAMAVIENAWAIKIAANRLEGVKRGIAHNFIVQQSDNYEGFWQQVLEPNLLSRHDAKPVHTLAEILQLKKLFPQNIKLFTVLQNDKIAAGTVIFETETVAHAQYISANADKGETGSLDFLYHQLITKVYAGKKYFDFGISNEQQGRKLNEGLAFWKESFGARTIAHNFYEVQTANYHLLDTIFIE